MSLVKSYICVVSVLSGMLLLGCDGSQLEQAVGQKYTEQAETKRLTEVAGQATVPMQTVSTEHIFPRIICLMWDAIPLRSAVKISLLCVNAEQSIIF